MADFKTGRIPFRQIFHDLLNFKGNVVPVTDIEYCQLKMISVVSTRDACTRL